MMISSPIFFMLLFVDLDQQRFLLARRQFVTDGRVVVAVVPVKILQPVDVLAELPGHVGSAGSALEQPVQFAGWKRRGCR